MTNRRQFLRNLGVSSAALPFLTNLPSLGADAIRARKQRLIIMFTPNGTLPDEFWPSVDGNGEMQFPAILKPLEPFKEESLLLEGLCNMVRGDGDGHMRGMSCLLTGNVLHPGNIKGGGGNPAGWASSISIDQEIKNFLQKSPATRTRFGSLEVGVAVPDRADPWTRMSYAGSNQPVAPLSDPYEMLDKLYGGSKDRETYASLLDQVGRDLKKVAQKLSTEDRVLLDQHVNLVRELEKEMKVTTQAGELLHPEPDLDPNIELINDNTPQLARMQMDLLINAMANDMARVSSIQFTRSVSHSRMRWLGIEEGHHYLSHQPDDNKSAYNQLLKINTWFAEQLAYLAGRLRDTPEPGGDGSMLDNTTILWVNELGKGNNHTLNNIPFLAVGGGLDYKMGRLVKFEEKTPHNRFLMSLAHSFGNHLPTFGQEKFCVDGPLSLS